jgi:glycine cleavage system aminomethyltransferase T
MLQERLSAAGARIGRYRGAETPLSFGDTALEFRTLMDSCGFFDLSWQAKLALTGKDRVRWLNGMVTNNIRDLALDRGVYNYVLTPQGHNQGDLIADNRGDYLLVTTDREQVEKLTTVFQRHIIMDQV